MKETLITSSVLIVVILLVRWMFRSKVSQRLIYAAWLLVALRLLIPIQFGQSQYSITALTERIENNSKPIQQVQEAMDEPVAGPSRAELYDQLLNEYLQQSADPDRPEVQETITPDIQAQIKEQVDEQIAVPTISEVLTAIWIVGICAMAAWFIIANVVYLKQAKQGAVPFTEVGTSVPVRISPSVPTPCLVGFFRPVIYLTPASAENEQSRNHVLTHELTHLRHGDHIWAMVRCICLCIYWFDPLVWIAAHQSRRDCELACDESALKKLGDEERIAYGKTLLDTVTQSMSPVHLLETATAMNESKKQLKERVSFIVKKPKSILIAAICLILVAAIAAGCTFTGSQITESAPTAPPATTDPSDITDPPSTDPTPTNPPELIEPVYVSMLFDDPTGWYRMALTSEYSDPKDLDLAKFFANGIEENSVLTDAEWDTLKDFSGFERDPKRIRRLPVNDMNSVLNKCFGLSLSDMNGVGLEKMVYLESTDCYYLMSGEETVTPQFRLEDVISNSIIYYTSGDQTYRVDIHTTVQNDRYAYHIKCNRMTMEDQIRQTTELAEKHLGMTRLEFLYTGNQIIQHLLLSSNLPASVKQDAKDTIIWDANAITNRALYLNDNGKLMMRFRYVSLADEGDPLYGTNHVEFDLEKYGLERPAALRTKSYQWLWDLHAHSDGFQADSYYMLLLDTLFAEPDTFTSQLSRQDDAFIEYIASKLPWTLDANERNSYEQLLEILYARCIASDRASAAQTKTVGTLQNAYHAFAYGDDADNLHQSQITGYTYHVCQTDVVGEQGWGYQGVFAKVYSSHDQLTHYLDTNLSTLYDFTTTTTKCPYSYLQVMSQYTESYFEDKILIDAFTVAQEGFTPVIGKIEIVDGVLRICYLSSASHNAVLDHEDRQIYRILIELPASYMEQIERIDVCDEFFW